MANKRKSYPVVGGPLDGLKTTSDEFERGFGEPGEPYYQPPGRFAELAEEYLAFNCGSNLGRGRGGKEWDAAKGRWVESRVPSMVWLHRSLFERDWLGPADFEAEEPVVAGVERQGPDVRFSLRLNKLEEDTEELVEKTLASLGASGQMARPEGDGLRVVFTLPTEDRDAALVEVTTALVEAGVPPFLALDCEPHPESVLMPAGTRLLRPVE